MTVSLDHTIVPATDKETSANFLGQILGVEPSPPFGPFTPLTLDSGVSLDFASADRVESHHYAFRVDELEFGPIFDRIKEAGARFYAYPGGSGPGQTNHRRGGEGVYFDDPDGHVMEVFWRPQTPA